MIELVIWICLTTARPCEGEAVIAKITSPMVYRSAVECMVDSQRVLSLAHKLLPDEQPWFQCKPDN